MSEIIKQEGDFKLQKRKPTPKKLNKPEVTTKVEIKDPEVTKVEIEKEIVQPAAPEVAAEVQTVVEPDVEPENVIEEIEQVEPVEPTVVTQEQVEEIEQEYKAAGKQLPENIEKLIAFMEETGGTVEDYARLNIDYSTIKADALLREYYRKSRPHLDGEEIEFLMDDKFSYDEEIDDERDIRKKKLAFKEEVAKAKAFLEDVKSKYYDEIKLKPSVNKDQQKALDFFNRYKEDQSLSEQRYQKFKDNTKTMFSSEFKGFEFNLGEKSFRYGVNNVDTVAEKQSDINNVIKKFLNKDGEIADYKGYHKALYAADNVDSIAKHFYEQGKADAVKDIVAKSNNITTEPRQNATSLNLGGFKVKAVNGVDSSKLRIQKRF
jgi:hypothetical protein